MSLIDFPDLKKKLITELDEDDQLEFLDQSRLSFVLTLRWILAVGSVLAPFWIILDFFVTPEILEKTIYIRLLVTAFLVSLFALTFHKHSANFSAFIGAALVVFISCAVFYVVDIREPYLGGGTPIFDLRACVFFALLVLAFFPSFMSAFHTAVLTIVSCNVTVSLITQEYNIALLNFPLITMCALSLGINLAVSNTKKQAFIFQKETDKMAITDDLTGLYNRRYFLRQKEEIARAQRYNHSLSVIMMDVDHFKRINDQYGHHAGDEVLKQLSEICAKQIRQADLIARMHNNTSSLSGGNGNGQDDMVLGRIGGEEYALLLPETNLEGAIRLSERMRKTIEETAIIIPNGERVHMTMSFGVTTMNEGDKTETLDAMIMRADKALYEAKKRGRNCVVADTDICS